MNQSQEILDLLNEETDYDKAVDALDTLKGKLPPGFEDVIDLMAQVLNGGLEQWISNGYMEDGYNICRSFLSQLGPIGKECSSQLAKLKPKMDAFKDYNDEDEPNEDDYEDLAMALDPFDDWMYANKRHEKIAGEMLKLLKDKKLIEASSGARQLASSSDKAKYKGLGDQIDKLETEKIEIRGKLANLVGKDGTDAEYDKLTSRRTAILDQVAKLHQQRTDMLKKYRGLRTK